MTGSTYVGNEIKKSLKEKRTKLCCLNIGFMRFFVWNFLKFYKETIYQIVTRQILLRSCPTDKSISHF